MADGEWHAEVNKPESVGDIMWQLANILWRLYAQVSGGSCCSRGVGVNC
jgi:hypothetical protein